MYYIHIDYVYINDTLDSTMYHITYNIKILVALCRLELLKKYFKISFVTLIFVDFSLPFFYFLPHPLPPH